VTVTPTLTSKQGLLMQAEWRHRLINGSYSIKAAGIFQADPGAFEKRFTPLYPGDKDPGRPAVPRQHRHHRPVRAEQQLGLGLGRLARHRPHGHPGLRLRSYFSLMDPFKSGGLETVTQLYLTGRGERSYFDARAMYFYGLSASDVQSQLPIVHPVVDYKNKLASRCSAAN
jgi:LPS-assembly protein